MEELELHQKLHPVAAAKEEYIICAALYYPNGIKYHHQPKNIKEPKNGIVICGRRHHNCFVTLAAIFPERINVLIEQGFLTSKDRFVDRKEAGEISLKAGQISDKNDCLFSEDLY